MTCDEIRNQAPLYLSGELPAPERAQFSRHLAACAACEHEIDAQAALDARLARTLRAETHDTSRVERRVASAQAPAVNPVYRVPFV